MGDIIGAETAYPSGASEFTHGLQWGSCYSIFSVMCMYCRSLLVHLTFFFWPLCCLSFDLRILINPLISSNSSSAIFRTHTHYMYTNVKMLSRLLYLSIVFLINKSQTDIITNLCIFFANGRKYRYSHN